MNKKERYSGVDFSGTWRVSTYEGKTILAPWSFIKNTKGDVLGIEENLNGFSRPLVGFSNYRIVAQAAKLFGGVAIRD